MKSFIPILAFSLLLFSCNTREKERKEEGYYFDFKVRGEEENDVVTILLQFRSAQNQKSVPLPVNSQVLVDGEALAADSSKYGGTFYEVQKPASGFAGRHRIEVRMGENVYSEEFIFQPIILETEIPPGLRREDWRLSLAGALEGEPVSVIVTDTSFQSADINKVDTVRNNLLMIKAIETNNLVPGPIFFQFYKLEKIPVNGSGQGGRILIEYGLKRESHLSF